MTDDRWTDELGFTDLATDEREETVKKVKELIQNLPEKYPDIFDDADISSQDYQRELRDAVFSLGGATVRAMAPITRISYRPSSWNQRLRLVYWNSLTRKMTNG
ncbi:hypothetical protein ACFQER_03050 [Halomicroarcula sp. GCM10025894]|uniref:hypothetical protein n=1 Tax=Halomicroarcula sp. GCM10025894 TaxID=3252673 RepID=UPI00361D704F